MGGPGGAQKGAAEKPRKSQGRGLGGKRKLDGRVLLSPRGSKEGTQKGKRRCS
jgi:hypothetical protein